MARAVIRLQGEWAKSDKMFIGAWPADSDIDMLYCTPGNDSKPVASHPPAPGCWVTCTSGNLLMDGKGWSPQGWNPPPKSQGVRWGVQIDFKGRLLFSCAASGEELQWEDLHWNDAPTLPVATNLAIAVLLQPHNRMDDLKAEIVIEEAGVFAP